MLISGEAGIGKSVLVDGLRAEVRREGLPRIAFRCSPYHTNSALHPVIEHVRRLLRWQPGDAAEARLTGPGGNPQPIPRSRLRRQSHCFSSLPVAARSPEREAARRSHWGRHQRRQKTR